MNSIANTRHATIWLKTLGLAAGFALLVYICHLIIFNGNKPSEVQPVALSVALCLFGLLLLSTAVLMLQKLYRQRQQQRAARILPEIRTAWAARIGFGSADESLREWYRLYPAETESVAAEVLSRLRGESLAAAAEAMQEIGLVEKWRKQLKSIYDSRRQRALHLLSSLPPNYFGDEALDYLEDPSEDVRIEAFRCIATMGDRMLIEAVYPRALEGSRYERTLLSGVFRDYLDILSEDVIPELLNKGDDEVTVAMLEFLLTSEQAVAIEGIENLQQNPNPQIVALLELVRPYLIDTSLSSRARKTKISGDDEDREFRQSDLVFKNSTLDTGTEATMTELQTVNSTSPSNPADRPRP